MALKIIYYPRPRKTTLAGCSVSHVAYAIGQPIWSRCRCLWSVLIYC